MIKQFERNDTVQPSIDFNATEAKENNLIGKKLAENRLYNQMTIDDVCERLLDIYLQGHSMGLKRTSQNWQIFLDIAASIQREFILFQPELSTG